MKNPDHLKEHLENLLGIINYISRCGYIELLALKLWLFSRMHPCDVYTIFIRADGDPIVRIGVHDIDLRSRIRVFVGDGARFQQPDLKQSQSAREEFVQRSIYSAIYHNVCCRIIRAGYQLPMELLPLFINYELPLFLDVERERYKEPWLTEARTAEYLRRETESHVEHAIMADGQHHPFFFDFFPQPPENKHFKVVPWAPWRGLNAQPRPIQGFLIVKAQTE